MFWLAVRLLMLIGQIVSSQASVLPVDMATELRCADLLTLNTAWRLAQGAGRLIGRPQPGRDDKAIAAWNGLMVRALADGRVLAGGLPAEALPGEAERWHRFLDVARRLRALFFSIFAQVSRSDTVRLKTSLVSVLRGSTEK